MTVQASVRSYVGIAKENTKGTAVQPTDFIPVSKDSLKPVDVIDPLYDTGLRGSNVMNYNYIQGRKRSTFDFGGAVFADTIGYSLAGMMGGVVTTGGSAPYTHEITLLNSTTAEVDTQPISYTLTDFYAVDMRNYPGCQFSDFSLKFNADGMLEYDTKTTGYSSVIATQPTPSFSTLLPTPVWQGSVSIAETTVATAMEGTLAMKRAATPIYGISNTQDPFQVFLGALEVTGTVKFVMENDDQLLNFLENTQPAIQLVWNYGTGANEIAIVATIQKGAYTTASISRGDDYVSVSIELNAQGNTDNAGATGGYSPIAWTLLNAKPSGTYAFD